MRRLIHRKSGGYSLIEMIIYVAILVVVAGLIIEGLLPLAINGSATVALERIAREVRQASDVSVSSVLNSSPGTLILTSTDPSGNPTTYTFDVSGGVLRITEGGSSPYALTGSGVNVSTLIFTSQTNATSSKLVGIDLVLSASSGSTTRTSEFKTSATLRNGY